MTHVQLNLLLLALFFLSMTTYAASRNILLLATANAICMICSPLLGGPVFLTNTASTFSGTLFFAVTMYGVGLKYRIYGVQEARRATRHILFALSLVFGAVFLLQDAGLLSPLFDARVQVAGARFVSFCLIQVFFIHLLCNPSDLPILVRLPLISIILEIVDAIVFFPIAFLGALPWDLIWEYALAGIVLRIIVTLLSVPFLAGFLWLERAGMTPGVAIGKPPA